MYKNSFVLAIKNGDRQILRETTDQTVSLPYESTYSIFLKNKNNCSAGVELSIDGEDILGGEKIIVPANGNIDLERFVKEGAESDGCEFKFTKPTKELASGKKKKNIGKIVARFYLEKKQQNAEEDDDMISWKKIKKEIDKIEDRKPYLSYPVPYLLPYPVPYYPPHYRYRRWWEREWISDEPPYPYGTTTPRFFHDGSGNSTWTTISCNSSSFDGDISSSFSISSNSSDTVFLANDNSSSSLSGITIEGEESEQDVDMDYIGELSDKCTVICLTIKPSIKALTVSKTKKKHCPDCGSSNKNIAKFCMNCGKKLKK